ncbi:MAG: PAS-domain containing protein [Sneathiella sp.]|nr:PAS-domain containing protein [Sneathiella sp.]
MSADFYLVYTNKKFLEIVDLPQELMVIGKTHLSDVFRYNAKRGEYGDGDIEEQVSLRMELASKCEPHSFERTRPDGAVIKVDGNPLPDGGFITTYTDVSELHASRIALEKVNNKLDERVRSRTKELASRTAELSEKATTLETVMQNVDTGITLLDKDLKLTLWNDRYFELLNCPEELLFVGATVETILKEINQGPDSGEEFSDDEFETIIKSLKNFEPYQSVRKQKNGQFLEVRRQPTPAGLLVTVADVSDQKNAEAVLRQNNEILEERVEERTRELRSAKEFAEKASSTKSQFLANMSHELRTPLNAIIGFSELLSMNDYSIIDQEKRSEYAKDINSAGVHLLQVINDILDVAKIEANQIDLLEQELELESIIGSCIQMVSVTAKNRSITLSTEYPDNLPYVYADPTRIKQVVANLLSNAIKFTDPDGEITVRVRILADRNLSISVIDNGIGIPQEQIGHVQTQFGQIQSTYNRNHQGTGLGLSLVRLLTEAHGGRFELESELGVGTTAHIILPAERIISVAA